MRRKHPRNGGERWKEIMHVKGEVELGEENSGEDNTKDDRR